MKNLCEFWPFVSVSRFEKYPSSSATFSADNLLRFGKVFVNGTLSILIKTSQRKVLRAIPLVPPKKLRCRGDLFPTKVCIDPALCFEIRSLATIKFWLHQIFLAARWCSSSPLKVWIVLNRPLQYYDTFATSLKRIGRDTFLVSLF